jgi:hypothetical protein
MGREMGTATSSTINIGTLGVDMYDSASNQLVWRGSGTKTLDSNPKPQKRQENIEKAVTKPAEELSAAHEVRVPRLIHAREIWT